MSFVTQAGPILHQGASRDCTWMTGAPVVIRPGRRDEDWPPENLLQKWRRHAGCGFNLSTVWLLWHLLWICHPEEAETLATRRSPDEGPMNSPSDSSSRPYPDLLCLFTTSRKVRAIQPLLKRARNAPVLRLLSSGFAGR